MPVPSYTTTSFASLQQSLALKLSDISNVFYTVPELQWAIQDSLRMWNCITGDNKVTYALPLTTNTIWYDLQTISHARAQTARSPARKLLRIRLAIGLPGRS